MDILLIGMIILGTIIFIVFASRWHATNYEYECKECKKRFSLTPFKDFSGVLAIDEKHVNCPFCKRKVWAKMKRKLMSRKAISTKGAVSVGPYSQGIESGEFIFLSGQTPIDSNTGKLVEGDIKAQTEQCFMNLFHVLSAADLTPENLVKVNVFLTDMTDFNAMNTVYATKFTAPYPARTTIGVASLPLGAQVEIDMIARKK